jgi:hypothetical protein
MTAAEALRRAHAAGVQIATDGCDLLLEAQEPAPAHVLSALASHKNGIIALLRAADCGWSAADWQAYFDERAGIAEFDGGLSREDAEARAFACCVAEWLNRHPALSSPGRCLACGSHDHGSDALLPFGIEPIGHAWLHARCWSAWYANRKAEAIAALSAVGITASANFPDDFGKNGGA